MNVRQSAWKIFFAVICAGWTTPCLAQGPAHVHSVTGNGPSYSVSKIWNEDGSYSINESYINGWTDQRWSRLYTSRDNRWWYSGMVPRMTVYQPPRAQRVWNPQTIRPTQARAAWIQNPYFRESRDAPVRDAKGPDG